MGIKNKLKQLSVSWYFPIAVSFFYLAFFFFSPRIFFSSITFFSKVFLQIIPIFLLILILMSLINYFITPKFMVKHMQGKGLKKWAFVIIAGVLSAGPIYMWYPLLAELKDKGLNYGMIACFLYNRAIKIPLLPLMAMYFSWKYIMILSFIMVLASVAQGIIINKLMVVTDE